MSQRFKGHDKADRRGFVNQAPDPSEKKRIP